MFTTLIHVALGGAIGASLRFGVGQFALRFFGVSFPWGTMAVNVAGSFVMGLLAMSLVQSESRLAPFLLTGVLGGFTTFSAFSLDAVSLFERGQTGAAIGYVAGSVGLSIMALIAGATLARSLA